MKQKNYKYLTVKTILSVPTQHPTGFLIETGEGLAAGLSQAPDLPLAAWVLGTHCPLTHRQF